MSSFKIFDIAGSGMSAQSVRLNTTASNLANADSVSGDPNQVYKARHPLFEAVRAGLGTNAASAGVSVKGIYENQAAPSARYEPPPAPETPCPSCWSLTPRSEPSQFPLT